MEIFLMKLIIAIILACMPARIFAQDHDIHNRITSETWETIATIIHKVIDDYEYYPVFNEKIRALDGKTVTLKGYIVPIKDGVEHSSFLLSVLPINQCFFCGKNGIPMMVEVHLKKPVKYTPSVIMVRGTLKLYEVNAAFECPVVIQQASIIQQ
jgi:hypothetical protein